MVPLERFLLDSLETKEMDLPASTYWSALVSCTRTLSHLYQSFHWQTSGAQYYGDHLLYERLYSKVDKEVDGIAERAIGLMNNPKVVHPLAIVTHMNFMIGFLLPEGDISPGEMPIVLLKAEQHYTGYVADMISSLKKSASILGNSNIYNDGVEDLLQGLVSAHQENIYLLQQRIGNPIGSV